MATTPQNQAATRVGCGFIVLIATLATFIGYTRSWWLTPLILGGWLVFDGLVGAAFATRDK